MEALEAAFDTFRNALRDPKLGAPDALGRQLRADLYTASALLRSPATTSTTYVRTTFGGLAIVLAMYVLWTLARRLAAEHISS
jgi:hypothetical protein